MRVNFMKDITKQLIISDLAPTFFRAFGKIKKDELFRKGSNGEISLEAMGIGLKSGDGVEFAKCQNAFVDSIISKMRDNAVLAVLKNVDEEQADELNKAMAKVDSIKSKVFANYRSELNEIKNFFIDTTDVDKDILKKVFSANYVTGIDKLEIEK